MNTIEQQALAAPQEFNEDVYNGRKPDRGSGPMLIQDEQDNPRAVNITMIPPTRTVHIRTGGGREIQVAVTAKDRFFCAPEQELKMRGLNCAVSTRTVQRGKDYVEVLGKVIVTDRDGKVIARFADPQQALSVFKRLHFEPDRLNGGERLKEPMERPGSAPKTRRGRQESEDKLMRVIAEMAANQKQDTADLIAGLTQAIATLAAAGGKALNPSEVVAAAGKPAKANKLAELQKQAEQAIKDADAKRAGQSIE